MTAAHHAVTDRAADGAAISAHAASSWRTLRYRRDDERAVIAAATADALRRWRADWGLSPAGEAHGEPGLTCVHASEWKHGHGVRFGATQWRRVSQDLNGAALWWAVVPPSSPGRLATPRTMLLGQLFGVHGGIVDISADDARPVRGIAQEVADLALADCVRALAGVFELVCDIPMDEPLSPAQPALAACFDAWSGALVASTPWCTGDLHVLIDDACASRLVSHRKTRAVTKRSPLTPVLRALASKPISLDVALSPFELDLGTLSVLRVGDVVRTTHRIEAPLFASTRGGDRIGEAYLGRCGPVRAAELQSVVGAPEDDTAARLR